MKKICSPRSARAAARSRVCEEEAALENGQKDDKLQAKVVELFSEES